MTRIENTNILVSGSQDGNIKIWNINNNNNATLIQTLNTLPRMTLNSIVY
jgi:WD40 repeat protein